MRSTVTLLLALILVLGLSVYIIRYLGNGESWAAFPVNKHLYSGGVLVSGTVKDINGVTLVTTKKGERVYNEKKKLRTATLHAVGDKGGNISTAAQAKFAHMLTNYNLFKGAYSLGGTGCTLTLTIDSELCAEAYDALDGAKGTVAVMNYKTGDLICMVSSPSFDPEKVPKDILTSSKYRGAYMNRLLSSTYTPGSVMKLVTTAAAYECLDDYDSWSYKCKGKTTIGGVTVTCPKKHGQLTVKDALAVSCNCAYAELSTKLTPAQIRKYASEAGLTKQLEFNTIRCAEGSIRTDAGAGELAWAAIGQDKDLVCPANMLVLMGAIARGGDSVKPNLISGVTTSLGFERIAFYRENGARLLSKKTANELAELMRNNVLKTYGEDRFKKMELCAKSGTAEHDNGTNDAWFVGFSQREDFPYAFVTVVEGTKSSGGKAAANIAGRVLRELLK